MGTRAVVRFGDTRIATHWDGYPSSLGSDLLKQKNLIKELDKEKSLAIIIGICEPHTIDFATEDVRSKTADQRLQKIANKANEMCRERGEPEKYSVQYLKELEKEGKQLTFGVHGAGDYPIGTFENYGDYAEWEYDVLPSGAVMYRELSGWYNETTEKQRDEWKKLTKRRCKQNG